MNQPLHRRAIALGVALALGLHLQPSLAQTMPLTPSTAAPAGQRPIVDSAANGVPLVHIAPPNAAGVSRNGYRDFNVNANGLILNNSPGAVQTQLGGWVPGNPQLGYAPARLIVNEVLGTNPSALHGAIEVAGRRADVVIANPNGLLCDGCSFLNTGRASLATGVPQYGSQGQLTGMDVRQGVLTVGANGLNAAELEQLDLIARGLVLEGGVWAQQLQALAGANQVGYAATGALPGITPQAGSGSAPRFAIDIKDLGGMYAHQIYLLATEQGLGVNSTGRIAALQGGLQLAANGDLSLRDSYARTGLQLSSAGQITLTGLTATDAAALADIHIVAAGTLRQQGTLDASGQLRVEAASLDHSGDAVQRGSAAPMQWLIAGDAFNTGRIFSAGDLQLQARRYTDAQGQLQAQGALSLRLSALALQGGLVSAGSDVDLRVAGAATNAGGQVLAGGGLAMSASALDNAGGTLQSGGAMRIALGTGRFGNDAGLLASGDALQLSGGDASNRGGSIASGGPASLTLASLSNDGGQVQAGTDLALDIAGSVESAGGALLAGRDLRLQADTLAQRAAAVASAGRDVALNLRGTLSNHAQSSVLAGRDLSVSAGTLGNEEGTLAANGQASVTARSALANDAGRVTAGGTLALETQGGAVSNRGGLMAGAGDVVVKAGAFDNSIGRLVAGRDLSATTQAFGNDGGLIQAGGDLAIDTQAQDLANTRSGSAGGIVANGRLRLAAGRFDNRDGLVSTGGAQSYTLTGEALNDGGRMVAGGDVELAAANVQNSGGLIGAVGNLSLTSAGAVANQGGQLLSGQAADIRAAHIDNTAGGSVQAATLNLLADTLDNRGGSVQADALSLMADALDNRGGNVAANATLSLATASLDNTAGGQVQSAGTASVQAATLANTGGRIVADGGLQVDTDSAAPGGTLASANSIDLSVHGAYDNTGEVLASQRLTVRADHIANSGHLKSGGTLDLRASGDIANSGEISAVDTEISAGGRFSNSGLVDGTRTTITAQAVSNTGRLYGDWLQIEAGTLSNEAGGTVAARQGLSIRADQLRNTDGSLLYSLGDLSIGGLGGAETQHLVNTASTIEGRGQVDIAAATLDNLNGGVTSTTVTTTQATQDLFIQPESGSARIKADALGWDPTRNHDAGGYVVDSSTYPMARFGTLPRNRAVGGDCRSDGDGGEICTPRYTYPPDDPVWALFQVAAPDYSDLSVPKPPANFNGCIIDNGDTTVRNASPDCAAYWRDEDAYYATVAQRNASAYGALDAQIVAFNTDLDARGFDKWHEFQSTQRTSTTPVLISTQPARILAGGDLTISGQGTKTNDASLIVAGGVVSVAGSAIDNQDRIATESVTEQGQMRYRYTKFGGYGSNFTSGSASAEYTDWTAYTDAPEQHTFKLATAYVLQHEGDPNPSRPVSGASAPTPGTASAAPRPSVPGNAAPATPTPLPPASIPAPEPVTLRVSGFQAPASTLFSVQPAPAARFLVETDPRFTDYRRYISSDYFLQQLQLDPERQLKRYGDGFAEQQLLTDQVLALTGRRYLSGYADTEAEYQALMQSGVAFAKQYQLTPGVALNAEQMAALTTDLVWLESQDVQLPGGGTQQVLVPRLYLRRVQNGDLQPDGALIAGSTVRLASTAQLANSGSIVGDTVLAQAQDLVNTGSVRGQQVGLHAGQDLKLVGGQIQGTGDHSVVQLTAGRDIVLTTTTQTSVLQTGSSSASRTAVDRIATIQGGSVSLQAAHDLLASGASVQAGQQLLALAGHDIVLKPLEQTHALAVATGGNTAGRTGHVDHEEQTNQLTTFSAGEDLTLAAQGKVDLQGSALTAGGDALVQGREIVVQAALDRQAADTQAAVKNRYSRAASADESAVGGQISANGRVALVAEQDLTLRGAQVQAGGDAVLQAGGTVTVDALATRHSVATDSYQHASGLLGSNTRSESSTTQSTQAEASTVSGHTVRVIAGQDIDVTGSNLVSDIATALVAGRDVNIANAVDTESRQEQSHETTSGLLGGGVGITLGTRELKQSGDHAGATAVASTVASVGGNVSISAGRHYTQVGSSVLTPGGDIHIAAQSVSITEAREPSSDQQGTEFKQGGVTLSLSVPGVESALGAEHAAQAARAAQDPRMRALATATAAAQAVAAARQLSAFAQTAASNAQAAREGVNVNLSVGAAQASTRQQNQSDQGSGSQLRAGGHVEISATGGGQDSNILIRGSDVQAGGNILLKADNRVDLLASSDLTQQQGQDSSNSASAGVSVNLGRETGVGVTASGSNDAGHQDGSTLSYQNTHVAAGNRVTIQSGGDTTLKGAVVTGQQVTGEIGGKLHIESLQDSAQFTSRQQGVAGSGTAGWGGGATVSASHSQVDADYLSVGEQSGIKTGDGGFQLDVKGGTELQGGVIASSQAAVDANRNHLATQSLSVTDLQNHNLVDAQSLAVTVSTSGGGAGGFQHNEQGASTTRAGLSAGAVTITGDAQAQASSAQALAHVDRSVTSEATANGLGKTWDGQQLAQQAVLNAGIVQGFGAVASHTVGDFAQSQRNSLLEQARTETDPTRRQQLLDEANRWDEGGAYRVAAHAVVGGLSGNVSGLGALQGAAGAATSAAAAPVLDALQVQVANGLASAGVPATAVASLSKLVTGAAASVVGGAVGGTGGTIAAANEEFNNRQLHPQELTLISRLAQNKARQSCAAGDTSCVNAQTIFWTDTLQRVASGMVDDRANAQNQAYLAQLSQASSNPGGEGAMGGLNAYVQAWQTAQTMLAPYAGLVIVTNGQTATADGSAQTYFSATPAQRADPQANTFLGQSPGSLIPGHNLRDQTRLENLSAQNGAAMPDTTAETLLIGGKITGKLVDAVGRVIRSGIAEASATAADSALAAAQEGRLVGGANSAKGIASLDAQNVANVQKLAAELRLQSAQSPFTPTGGLTRSAIEEAMPIPGLGPGNLNNPNIPAGFGKYTTGTFHSPSGDFQIHFYMNPDTKEVFYGLDYKIIFNRTFGGKLQ